MDKTITYSYSKVEVEEKDNYLLGTEANYSCSPGFGLSSTQTRTCVDVNNGTVGRFNGNEPTCKRELLNLLAFK